jgi:hypothetical protein
MSEQEEQKSLEERVKQLEKQVEWLMNHRHFGGDSSLPIAVRLSSSRGEPMEELPPMEEEQEDE